jgi:membrane protease YdiL (CAAX protease family)
MQIANGPRPANALTKLSQQDDGWSPTASDARPFTPFLAYVVLFHVAWIFWPYVVYPKLVATFGDRTLAYALVQLSIRLLVWVVPVWCYLRFVDRVDPLQYLKMTGHVRRGLVVALVLTAVNLAGSIARFGPPHPSLDRVTWNSILGTSFLIGLIEEIPYRGFMLQKFAERLGFWRANLITSLLFVAIHVPGWIALNIFSPAVAVTILVFGFVMAVVFRYSGSLWAPIVVHSANDFMSFVLFHT